MSPSRRSPTTVAAAALAGLALTACGSGFDAQTNQRRTYSEGSHAQLGPTGQLLARNFYMAPPPLEDWRFEEGDDARVYGVLANSGDGDDRLLGASTPLAEEVVLVAGGDPEDGVAGHTQEFAEVFDDREVGANARVAPEGEGEVDGADLPGGSKLELLPGIGYLELRGLTQPVFPGTTFELTLEMEESGTVTFPVYVLSLIHI